MKDEEGQGLVNEEKGRRARDEEPFALLLLFIPHPSSFILAFLSFRRVHHYRICQNVQAFLLILDLRQLSTIRHTLHHGSHFG